MVKNRYFLSFTSLDKMSNIMSPIPIREYFQIELTILGFSFFRNSFLN